MTRFKWWVCTGHAGSTAVWQHSKHARLTTTVLCAPIAAQSASNVLRCRGHSFLSLNRELLDCYARCETAAEVIAAQTAFLEGGAGLRAAGRGARWLPAGAQPLSTGLSMLAVSLV